MNSVLVLTIMPVNQHDVSENVPTSTLLGVEEGNLNMNATRFRKGTGNAISQNTVS